MPSRNACNLRGKYTATPKISLQISQVRHIPVHPLLDIHSLQCQRTLGKYFCEFRKHGKGAIKQRNLGVHLSEGLHVPIMSDHDRGTDDITRNSFLVPLQPEIEIGLGLYIWAIMSPRIVGA